MGKEQGSAEQPASPTAPSASAESASARLLLLHNPPLLLQQQELEFLFFPAQPTHHQHIHQELPHKQDNSEHHRRLAPWSAPYKTLPVYSTDRACPVPHVPFSRAFLPVIRLWTPRAMLRKPQAQRSLTAPHIQEHHAILPLLHVCTSAGTRSIT